MMNLERFTFQKLKEKEVERLEISLDYSKPLKTMKVNIGIEEVTKFDFIETIGMRR